MGWVRLPERQKKVKYLYLVPGQHRFRSRHALGLTYRSDNLRRSVRYLNRAEKHMEYLGGGNPRLPPPRPKYMRRATYYRLCQEALYAEMCGWCGACDALGLNNNIPSRKH